MEVLRKSIWLVLCLVSVVSAAGTFPCEECACTEDYNEIVTEINCKNQGLTEVPSFIRSNYSNVEKLYLDYNDISVIRSDDFTGLVKLLTITITYNGLQYIEDHAFKSQGSLNILDLSHNALNNTSFEPDSFTEGNEIRQLQLSYNQLSVPPPELAKLKFLTNLHLNDNPLGPVLSEKAFLNYPSLTILDLSSCNIQIIENQTFHFNKVGSLAQLYLDHNNISVITKGIFKGANIRERLSMQNCNIRELKSRSFSPLNVLYLLLGGNNLSNQTSRNPFFGVTFKSLFLNNCSLTRLRRGFLTMTLTGTLNLNYNNIGILREDTFNKLEGVDIIRLSSNNISRIVGKPFERLSDLRKLYLDDNNLSDDSLDFLGKAQKLQTLDISFNQFTTLPDVSKALSLLNLYAARNKFTKIDKNILNSILSLEILQLKFNNDLNTIDDNALTGSKDLKILDVSFSALQSLPNIQTLQSLETLNLQGSYIRHLPPDLCHTAPDLKILYAQYNLIEEIPDLSNCTKLTFLILDSNKIKRIEENTLSNLVHLEELMLQHNDIEYIHPNAFHGLKRLEYLHLSNNNLSGHLPADFFRNLTRLKTISLGHNQITGLPENVFKTNVRLERLLLSNNDISTIGSVIFPPNMTWLQYLDISNNPLITRFPLPTGGFPYLQKLSMSGLPKLFNVPTVTDIPRVLTINFTYSYHCCIYKDYTRSPSESFNIGSHNYSDTVLIIRRPPVDDDTPSLPDIVTSNMLFPGKIDPLDPERHDQVTPEEIINALKGFQEQWNVTLVKGRDGKIDVISNNTGSPSIVSQLENDVTHYVNQILPIFHVTPTVDCHPFPNDLTPCENLLDPDPLAVIVWIIWFVALVGNIAVLFVVFVSKEKMQVPQIFICNLAFADFLLGGVYLAFLGGVDLKTRGQSFYKSALHWQTGPGCQSAGFIAVFSSELSVFTLVAMTLETTIAYSFIKQGHIKKQYALVTLLVCWILAAILALLPLLDVNTYSDVAICMPFRISSVADKLYINLILTLNLAAFFIIFLCYLRIFYCFCKFHSADSAKKEKCAIALRMGFLVIINLMCWLPLAVAGYAAVVDSYIIDYTTAKFFIVMIFPLNACCNPFVYTIFTKQFLNRIKSLCKRKENRTVSTNKTSSLRLSIRRNSVASTSDTMSAHRTSSPRSDIDYDLLARRRNHRSFSVQFVTPPTSQSPSSAPVSNPAPYMGRRYSSPAIFGPNGGSSSLLGRTLESRQPSDAALPNLAEDPAPNGLLQSEQFHRIHSKYLSTVHEETSDCDSDVETEVEAKPMNRRHSDPDVMGLQRLKVVTNRTNDVNCKSSRNPGPFLPGVHNVTSQMQASPNKEICKLSTSTIESISSASSKIYINPHSAKLSKNTEETSV